ncbi:MAG: hypothetical protein WDO12_11365 [Pseudomonadota bacterium]
MPEYGSCLLGSVNLTRFVVEPFTKNARFDWDEYKEVVRCSPACSTTWWRSTACRCPASARRSCASAATAWATSASAPPSRCSA